jgi:hypothetical protein
VKKLCILFLLLSLSGCSLLGFLGEPQKIIKNIAVTGVAFASGGIIPAVVVGGTALAVDFVMPHDTSPQITEIETEVQMKAFIISNLTDNIMYGAIAALLIFLIVVPWASQRRAKRQMKYDMMKRELEARRIKDVN